MQQKYSTAVLPMNRIKLNIGDVSCYDYTIHDGDYYSIFDKDNIISVLGGIEHKIIHMCQQNFI